MGAILFPGLLAVLLFFTSAFDLQAAPASVTLAWYPNVEANLAGYNVYYGTVSRVYPGSLSVSSTATSATVTNLQAGQTYYFAVTAMDIAGLESDYSAEIVYTPPNAVALQIRVASNRHVILTVTGTVGHNYDIQASSDFTAWTVIGTATVGVGGSFVFTDTSAANFPRRFYRLRDPQP